MVCFFYDKSIKIEIVIDQQEYEEEQDDADASRS